MKIDLTAVSRCDECKALVFSEEALSHDVWHEEQRSRFEYLADCLADLRAEA